MSSKRSLKRARVSSADPGEKVPYAAVPRTIRSRGAYQKNIVDLGRGFPRMIKMTHKYAETSAISSAAGVINYQRWSANGMFDPNPAVGGHQPMYFDNLSAVYDHYTVIGSMCKLTFIPTTASPPAGYVGVFIDDDNAMTATSINEVMEQTTGQFKACAVGNNEPSVFILKWSAKRFFSKDPLANTSLQGTSAANPTEQSYFVAAAQANGASTCAWTVTAEISYIAVWAEAKEQAQQ